MELNKMKTFFLFVISLVGFNSSAQIDIEFRSSYLKHENEVLSKIEVWKEAGSTIQVRSNMPNFYVKVDSSKTYLTGEKNIIFRIITNRFIYSFEIEEVSFLASNKFNLEIKKTHLNRRKILNAILTTVDKGVSTPYYLTRKGL